jgi:hypothetical protein
MFCPYQATNRAVQSALRATAALAAPVTSRPILRSTGIYFYDHHAIEFKLEHVGAQHNHYLGKVA